MTSSNTQSVPGRLSNAGPVTTAELEAMGFARVQITRMVRAGVLERIARGLYARADRDESEFAQLAQVAALVPAGVICLLTALRFHQLTTQAPFEVWLAIANKARAPAFDWPPVRLVRVADEQLRRHTESHEVEGVSVCVTNVARTVVDCFKHRNKIGLDVAQEALREAWKEQRVSMDGLWKVAKLLRQSNVMRPYLEALT